MTETGPIDSGLPLPEWLEPIRRGAESITVHDLTRFMPPEGSDVRHGAVLMLFGGASFGESHLLLTERAHHMRSHPGQVSFPGGAVDAGETAVQAALREAEEETGLDPTGVDVFAALPPLWLPPSNFSVTPLLGWWRQPSPVRAVHPDEVHEVYLEPIAELLDPEHRMSVRGPSGWIGPAFLIGEAKDLILWGFTAGIIARLFAYVDWARPWDEQRIEDLPAHMIGGPITQVPPNTDFRERP